MGRALIRLTWTSAFHGCFDSHICCLVLERLIRWSKFGQNVSCQLVILESSSCPCSTLWRDFARTGTWLLWRRLIYSCEAYYYCVSACDWSGLWLAFLQSSFLLNISPLFFANWAKDEVPLFLKTLSQCSSRREWIWQVLHWTNKQKNLNRTWRTVIIAPRKYLLVNLRIFDLMSRIIFACNNPTDCANYHLLPTTPTEIYSSNFLSGLFVYE